jgi:hypothetical protein
MNSTNDIHLVNCDLNPEIPQGFCSINNGSQHHRMGMIKLELKDGKLYANSIEVVPYLSLSQQNGETIQGYSLFRGELKYQKVLNACISDYLSEHPELIPESWPTVVCFWGTILYQQQTRTCGTKFVVCLRRKNHRWRRFRIWLGTEFNEHMASVILAD